MITLQHNDQKVSVENGELVGYEVNGHEYIHQKGSPGWRNSDTEMFPIIGPTSEAGFEVQVSTGNAIQDQHGLLRELKYELVSNSETAAAFRKTYKAGTMINNSKYPKKSTARLLTWPFHFEFQKSFRLNADHLEISFTVSGEKDMPFMLGYHPAFKLYSDAPLIGTSDKTITLNDVLQVGSRALEVADCDTITLRDRKELTIKTEGFGSFMLWTEVPNMICIEPITFYPYAVAQEKLHEGFQYLDAEANNFKVQLIP